MNTNFFLFTALLVFSRVAFPQFELPDQTSPLFSGSGVCAMCHTSNGSSVLTYKERDVSPITGWRSSMMANSSKDPFWRAMVAAETIEFPELVSEIETTCTRCHAPMGHTQAIRDGQKHYTIAQMKADPLSNDGVSCTLCHQIQPENFGKESSLSGGYIITDAAEIYGPYEEPFPNPMINHTGYTPVHGTHIKQSELCGTCHTVFTPVESGGRLTNKFFPEQMTYPEWSNSIYPANGINCKSCHMSRIDEGIDIAKMPPWHKTLRSPFSEHDFKGANAFMASVFRKNADKLSLSAPPELFELTQLRAEKLITNNAVNLKLEVRQEGDKLHAKVLLKNLTGHKLPTGIPLRRMWIHFKITDTAGAVLFESGGWNEQGEIIGKNYDFEPHYQIITSEDQVQIYEPVLRDATGKMTYSLISADGYIKDNRLPPVGFTQDNKYYESIRPAGVEEDKDFNRDGRGNDGTGSDCTEYKIKINTPQTIRVSASVCYQTVKPEIAEHLFRHSHNDITAFKEIYLSHANRPIIIGLEELVTEIK